MNKEPRGEAISAGCFREVNGREGSFVFASPYLSKALAFSFSAGNDESILNANIEGTDNEILFLAGGATTIDKPRDIRVYKFPSDGFEEMAGSNGRQFVSENPVPFARAENILETGDINELMRRGLQIMVMPDDFHAARDKLLSRDYSSIEDLAGQAVKDGSARWLNRECGINPCPVLAERMGWPLIAGAPAPSIAPTAKL